MKILTGCDLVNLKNFEKSLKEGGKAFLERIFSMQELAKASSLENKAGYFALKEAVMKALGFREWQKIEVMKGKEGKPEIILSGYQKNILSQDVSISHNGDYAMATAVFILEDC